MNFVASSSLASDTADGLVGVAFNQDFSCFAAGTEAGFRIYNTYPLKEKTRHEVVRTSSSNSSPSSKSINTPEDSSADTLRPNLNTPGGISIVEMMYRTNFVALVGGGRNPKFAPNRVIIWDDLTQKSIIELEFRSVVKGVRLRRERIIVALLNKVFVYTFAAHPQRLHTFETFDNERGLIGLSTSPISNSPGFATLVFPARSMGQLQVVDLALEDSPPPPIISIISAHDSQVSCLTVSYNGQLIASASDKGTLIRVFDAKSGRRLHELRRGADKAEIYCIAINLEGTRVCVASDKGTVHIFNLSNNGVSQISAGSSIPQQISQEGAPGNHKSSLSFLSPYVPYFSSEWSFAQFTLPSEPRCICAFATQPDTLSQTLQNSAKQNQANQQPQQPAPLVSGNSVIAVCADGSLYRFSFDPRKGGECFRESFHRYFHGIGVTNDYGSTLMSPGVSNAANIPTTLPDLDILGGLENWNDMKKSFPSNPVQDIINDFDDITSGSDTQESGIKIEKKPKGKKKQETLSDWEDDGDGLI
ncbi:WD repeat domain phosphoinositide-interacting protein 3 [Nowakowskiella sp. JEL0078]|nr:WD repeat domain phosphoinositide-interacting protein 3 [Nowakowskiella sp. JEL0078]